MSKRALRLFWLAHCEANDICVVCSKGYSQCRCNDVVSIDNALEDMRRGKS